jgi:tetratricopeptide (TPR) repeat protein
MRKTKIIVGLLALVLAGSCADKKPNPCRNPDYAEVLKKQAIAALEKGDLYGALDLAQQSEKCNPRDPEIQYWLGRIYLGRKQLPQAMERLQRALEWRQNYPEANLALGMTFLQLKRWDEAIAQYEIVTQNELFRTPEEAYNNIGWAWLMKGDPDQAAQSFQTALSINPNYCPAHCNLGEVQAQKGNSAAAIRFFQQALQLCPDYHRTHLLLGIEWQKQKNIPASCREFQAAMRAAPNSEDARRAGEYCQLLGCPAASP